MSRRLSKQQEAALRCLRANGGEASEGTLWLEGLNYVRVTMLSLERRGMASRRGYAGEGDGYLWALIADTEQP